MVQATGAEVRREITVNAPPESFAAAIRDLGTFTKQWPDTVGRIITGRFQIEDALQPLSGKTGGIKNIVTINTFVRGLASTIFRVASIPFMSGI